MVPIRQRAMQIQTQRNKLFAVTQVFIVNTLLYMFMIYKQTLQTTESILSAFQTDHRLYIINSL